MSTRRHLVELTPGQLRAVLAAIGFREDNAHPGLTVGERASLRTASVRLRNALHDCPGTGRQAVSGHDSRDPHHVGVSVCPVCRTGPTDIGIGGMRHRPEHIVGRHDRPTPGRGDTAATPAIRIGW